MGAIDQIRARPVRMAASAFQCWRLLDGGKAQRHVLDGDTLAEIEREIAYESTLGNTFMVRETDTLSGRSILHSYRVRRGSKPVGFDGSRKVYPYTADKLFAMEINAFEPVEPWRYAPGCDVVGHSGVIEDRFSANIHRKGSANG